MFESMDCAACNNHTTQANLQLDYRTSFAAIQSYLEAESTKIELSLSAGGQ